MLCVVTEVTDRIIGERHLRALRDLAAQSVTVGSIEETCERICKVLAGYPLDVAFGGLYLLDGSGARRVAQVRELPAHTLPESLPLDRRCDPWPIPELIANESTQGLRIYRPWACGFLPTPGRTWCSRHSSYRSSAPAPSL